MRKKIVAGNWKMNMLFNEGIKLASDIDKKLGNIPEDQEVIVCMPFIHIKSIADTAINIKCGAQNCASEESGAYTGEISAAMLESVGSEYVIIGHSERRSYFEENNELLFKKAAIVLKNNLKLIFCVGESLEERNSGIHKDIIKKQLEKGLFSLTEKDFGNCIIAYEPVWAIGTGLTASSEQAQEMHGFIRKLIEDRYGKNHAGNTSILYGGSCNPKNARELFSMKDVDGGLIGGASLKPDDFISIINSY